MNNPFPSKEDLSVDQSISVLNDGETFSSAEGSFWTIMSLRFDTDEIEELLEEGDTPIKLYTDAMPYLVRAGFLFLGIDPTGMTRDELLNELNSCSVSNKAELETIDALHLSLKR